MNNFPLKRSALSFLEKEEIPVHFAELYLKFSPDARLLAD
jgi:hypothetical protein